MPWRWRPDGDYVADVPPLRRIMPLLMPTRNQAAVYYEQRYDCDEADAYIERFRARTGLPLRYQHILTRGVVELLHARPRLNRFVAGGRIYQRRGIYVSFSGKKGKSDAHPLVTVKRRFQPGTPIEEYVRSIDGDIRAVRGDEERPVDRELRWLFRLPHAALSALIRLQRWVDHWGLLPGSFYANDPLYASLFIANLGSIRMDAPYHHLFDYGNIPLFLSIGQAKREAVVSEPSGEIEVRKRLPIRWSFDERIEDGLYALGGMSGVQAHFEDPEHHLGPVEDAAKRLEGQSGRASRAVD